MSGFAEDYIPVAERISAFYEKHPDGSLQGEMVELSPDRVVMRGYAYRTPDDPRPGIGYSSLEIPGKTPYTRGSEIENCETSAWGRAIAALGFEVKRGVASAEEVRNKTPEPPRNGHSAPRPVVVASRSTTDVPDDFDFDQLSPVKPGAPVAVIERGEGVMWSKELFERAEAAHIEKRAISDTAKRMFGKDKWKVTDLTDGERFALAVELDLA